MKVFPTVLTLLALVFSHQAEAAEYDCVMTIRSTVEGNDGLSDHAYRIREAQDGFELSQRTADGSWMSYGHYLLSKVEEFDVLVRLAGLNDESQSVSMVSIHKSGNAALLTHYGSWGNTSQYQKAWLTQGTCKLS